MSKATAVYLLSTVAASASAKLLTPQDASSSTLAAAGITLHRDHAPGAVRCEELLVPMDDAGAKFLTDEFHVKGFAVGPCPPAYNAFSKRERDYLGFRDVEYRQFMVKDVGAAEVVTLVRDHVVDTSDTTNDDHPDWFKFVHNYDNTHLSRFNMWSRAFQKIYATADEMREQFMKWAESDKIIRTTNEAGLSYTFGHNQFSDMTKAEFKEYIGGGFKKKERDSYLRREKHYNFDLLKPEVQDPLMAHYLRIVDLVRRFFGEWRDKDERALFSARAHILLEAMMWWPVWSIRYSVLDFPRIEERLFDVLAHGLPARRGAFDPQQLVGNWRTPEEEEAGQN